jgi:G3E family GTPase
MPQPVPVTVIGGADANRLARKVREKGDCIVGPTWNGHGSILIDADVAHRTPGCICCAMRLDVVDGLLRATRRFHRPRRILLVAEAGEDLTTITYTVLSDPDLARHVRLDGVVMALDAVASTTRLAGEGSVGSQLEIDALAVADLVVVDRSDELTSAGFDRLVTAVRAVNRVGVLWPPAPRHRSGRRRGDDIPVAITKRLDAWHGAPAVDTVTTFRAPPSIGGSDTPATVVLRQSEPLDPGAVDEWLARLVDTHARRLLRMQGALAVVSSPERVCCHGVRSFAMSHSESADPPQSRRHESLVLVIGRGLDVAELAAGFAATRSR